MYARGHGKKDAAFTWDSVGIRPIHIAFARTHIVSGLLLVSHTSISGFVEIWHEALSLMAARSAFYSPSLTTENKSRLLFITLVLPVGTTTLPMTNRC